MIILRTRLFVGLLAGCLVGTFAIGVASAKEPVQPNLSEYASGFARWEPAIAKFESLDRELPARPDSVLLIGSSSIRLWESAADDLAPYPIIRRGYGGARFSDVAHFAKRLVTPHGYQAAVVFVGNDVTGGSNDKTPEEVGQLFGYLADVITQHQPDAEVICCDVRPTPSRFRAWEDIQAANAALKAECDKRPNVHYLNTTPEFLTADGSAPLPELHRKDQLHLNADGYAIWSRQIKAELDRLLDVNSE